MPLHTLDPPVARTVRTILAVDDDGFRDLHDQTLAMTAIRGA